MNQPTTEQIRVVAEYDGWTVSPFDENLFIKNDHYGVNAKRIGQFDYYTSLDQIAPIYRKVMGELEYEESTNHMGSPIYNDAVKYRTECERSLSDLDPLAIFNACYEAIVFIQKHSNEKDNNPA